ncbi:hypothetical protein FKP32DRAFT_1615457 [Trametes sanguinea]|nr:hypothetical protein FKP32DRAFT_1615457 [Trametes sanguinea]
MEDVSEDRFAAAAAPFEANPPELPAYARSITTEWDVPPAEQVHHFNLTSKKIGSPWLNLTVISRAKSATDRPTFHQSAPIIGSVELSLDKETLIDEVSVALYGKLSIFSHSASNFLSTVKTLYSAAESHADVDPPPTLSTKRGRLQGRLTWPFSLRFPKGVSILSSITDDGHAERENYRLPATFSDAKAKVDIEYVLLVRVSRGGLKGTSKLTVPITYIPLARPCRPTISRQLAYHESTPLPGPDKDTEGWKIIPRTLIQGVLFKTVTVVAEYTLYISRPLSYTRGGPIHLLLSIQSVNQQLLDLINPHSIQLQLVQRITFGTPSQETRFSKRLSAQTTVKCIVRATASWWKAPCTGVSEMTRTFAGELLVPEDLVPACQILHYGHEYELCLYPFRAIGFTPSAPMTAALVSEPVNIVTAFAQGPRPLSYIPPRYDA